MSTSHPTQADVARLAGVSRGLVSLALSGAEGVNNETRARILAVAESIGYVRNLSAATLAGRRLQTIGVILPDVRNPYFEEIVSAITQRARERGVLPLITMSGRNGEEEISAIRTFFELRVRGIITVSPFAPAPELAELSKQGTIVAVGTAPLKGYLHSVRMDEEVAAQLVINHLTSQNTSHVAFIAPEKTCEDSALQLRRDGIERECVRAGIPFHAYEEEKDLRSIVTTIVHREHGKQYSQNEAIPSIVVYNDLVAMDVLTCIHACGFEIGRDVLLVSYDDTHIASRHQFQLTSVHQDAYELIDHAFSIIDGSHNESRPSDVTIAPTLVVRTSSVRTCA